MNICKRAIAVMMAMILLICFVGCSSTEPANTDSIASTTTVTQGKDGTSTVSSNSGEEATSTTTKQENGSTSSTGSENNTTIEPPAKTSVKATTKTTAKTSSGNQKVITVAGPDNSFFTLDAGESAHNREIREQLKAAEKAVGCTFQYKSYSSNDLVNKAIAAHKSGSRLADILMVDNSQSSQLSSAGALWNVKEVKGIHEEKEYWDQTWHKANTHMMVSTVTAHPQEKAYVLFFNKVLLKLSLDKLGQKVATPEAAANILYQMVNEGKWTFDQLQKISQKAAADLTGDGKMDDRAAKDQYGFAGVNMKKEVAYAIFKAKGGYFTKATSSKVSYSLTDAANITALKTMQTWLLKDSSIYNSDKYGVNTTVGKEAFVAGRVLFLAAMSDVAPSLDGMKDAWGIVPFPKADTKSEYTNIGSSSGVGFSAYGFAIPFNVKGNALDRVANAVETIGSRLFQVPGSKNSIYTTFGNRGDNRSYDMLNIVVKASVYNTDSVFNLETDLGEAGMPTIYYLFDNVGRDPAQRVREVYDEGVRRLAALTS